MDEYEEELECLARFGLKHTAKPGARIPAKMLPGTTKPVVGPTSAAPAAAAKEVRPTKDSAPASRLPKKPAKEDDKSDMIMVEIVKAPRNGHHAGGNGTKKSKKKKKGVIIKI